MNILLSFDLQEKMVEGYRCPKCGSAMSSGIQMPGGDYDDWFVQPHCTAPDCGFETSSGKRPFDYCVPTEPQKERVVGYKLIYSDPEKNPPSYHVSVVIPEELQFGEDYYRHGGGWIYDTAVVEELGYVVERQVGETRNAFYWRALREMGERFGQRFS